MCREKIIGISVMINSLKDIHRLRCDIESLPETHDINGKKIEIDFCCCFGYLGRSHRFFVKVDGKPVGFKEVFVPWNFTKDVRELFIYDCLCFTPEQVENIKGLSFEECPYSDTPLFYAVSNTLGGFLEIVENFPCVP